MKIHPEIASFIGIDEIIDYDFEKFFGVCPGCKQNLIHYDSADKNALKAMYCSSNYKTCKLLVAVKNFDKAIKIQDYYCRLDLKITTNYSTYETTNITIDYVNDVIVLNKLDIPRTFIDLKDVEETLRRVKVWETFS